MKIFVNHLDPQKIQNELKHLNHLDFSLFVEEIPKHQNQLSSINIITLHEPNEYFGLHDWVIQNKHLFQAILTWDDKVLNNCDNAIFLPFGHSWLKSDQYEKNHIKEFKLSHLSGILNKSYGHQMRHEILARENEFKMPTNFYKTIGDRHNIEDARIGKETVFSNSMFGVAIENFNHRGWFSEKILDCFLLKTIPIYWGCSNIYEFFDIDGIIPFENVDDIIFTSKLLTINEYERRKEAIEKNYELALQYINYEKNICNKIEEIFKLNNLI
jgi:hypothetical protein